MIDLTNYEHKRGVMILNSKDVRTIDRDLFDYKVNLSCIDTYLNIIKSRINKWDIDDSSKQATLQEIDFMLKDLTIANKHIEKAREIFR